MDRKKCPSCGRENLRLGKFARGSIGVGVSFLQEQQKFFSLGVGLRPKGYACKDCGHVAMFLEDQDRKKLDDQ